MGFTVAMVRRLRGLPVWVGQTTLLRLAMRVIWVLGFREMQWKQILHHIFGLTNNSFRYFGDTKECKISSIHRRVFKLGGLGVIS